MPRLGEDLGLRAGSAGLWNFRNIHGETRRDQPTINSGITGTMRKGRGPKIPGRDENTGRRDADQGFLIKVPLISGGHTALWSLWSLKNCTKRLPALLMPANPLPRGLQPSALRLPTLLRARRAIARFSFLQLRVTGSRSHREQNSDKNRDTSRGIYLVAPLFRAETATVVSRYSFRLRISDK